MTLYEQYDVVKATFESWVKFWADVRMIDQYEKNSTKLAILNQQFDNFFAIYRLLTEKNQPDMVAGYSL